jgi:hypothetical protein
MAYSPNGNLFLFGREDGAMALSANSRGALGQPPLEFNRFEVETEGITRINASVQPWTHYAILTSTNLEDWSVLSTVMSRTSELTISAESTSNAPVQFYRALTPP